MRHSEKKIIRKRLLRSYISSVISISLVLFLVGFFLLGYLGAQKLSDYFKENVRIVALLNQDVTENQAEQLCKNITLLPQSRSAELITKEQGTKEMEELLGEEFLDVFQTNPIPLSVNIQLKPEYFVGDSIEKFKSFLLQNEMVEDVIYQGSAVDSMNSNFGTVALVLLIFILLMLFISIVLINNTVRLNIFSKRFAVHTMQLVGATKGFIQRPFLYRAILQGLLSAIVAIIALAAIVFFASKQPFEVLSHFKVEEFAILAGILICMGVLICFICTWAVVRKMISMKVNDLYY